MSNERKEMKLLEFPNVMSSTYSDPCTESSINRRSLGIANSSYIGKALQITF